jgi:two-component system, OmpR family, sensor kinase
MTSLRRTALLWMTAMLSVVGIAGAAVSYRLASDEATAFLDSQLRQIALNAGEGVTDTADPPIQHDPEDDFIVEIWNGAGERLHASRSAVNIPRRSQAGFADVQTAGEEWRVYASSDGARTVQVAQRAAVRREIAQHTAISAAIPIVVVIPLAWLLIGWALARFLGRLTTVASTIAERSLDSKDPIPLEGVPKEVSPLVVAMNSLIERLHHALDQQRRFVSDAAHELRTPLTALRLQIENLQHEAGQGVTEACLTDLERGTRRASALVEQLSRMARYDASREVDAAEPVDLPELLKSCLADHLPIAESRGVDLGITTMERAYVLGARSELKNLFANLIDNAVRYTPSGGAVDVSIRPCGERAVVEIADTGCGISKDLLPRVFDRFFRAAPPGIEGNGLGLSIVKAIADRHDLEVELGLRDRGGLVATVSGAAFRRTVDPSFAPKFRTS